MVESQSVIAVIDGIVRTKGFTSPRHLSSRRPVVAERMEASVCGGGDELVWTVWTYLSTAGSCWLRRVTEELRARNRNRIGRQTLRRREQVADSGKSGCWPVHCGDRTQWTSSSRETVFEYCAGGSSTEPAISIATASRISAGKSTSADDDISIRFSRLGAAARRSVLCAEDRGREPDRYVAENRVGGVR